MPFVNTDKKVKIKALITHVIATRFGENWMDLDTERTEVEKENYKKMWLAVKESPTHYEKSISLNRLALHRLWSFIESNGNMTNSLYKDKMNDGVKSGKYALCKDLIAVFKTFIYQGDSLIHRKIENDIESKNALETSLLLCKRNKKIKELENTIEFYKKFYKSKHNAEFPSTPKKPECFICCGDFNVFDTSVKALSCCNNKLCIECLTKCIMHNNKCPFCRQNLMEFILKSMPTDK